jgi:hypothetical protein
VKHFGLSLSGIGGRRPNGEREGTCLIFGLIVLAAALLTTAGLLAHQPDSQHLQSLLYIAMAILIGVNLVIGCLYYGIDSLPDLIAINGVLTVATTALLYGGSYLLLIK